MKHNILVVSINKTPPGFEKPKKKDIKVIRLKHTDFLEFILKNIIATLEKGFEINSDPKYAEALQILKEEEFDLKIEFDRVITF